jgi:hypothetical protein
MDDHQMWEHKYNKCVTEIRKSQDTMKMERFKIGRLLVEMHEASKHLPDKKFPKKVKEDCNISKAKAYRHMAVYEELEWWPELVYNLSWSVLEKIAVSDLPQDWKKDLSKNGNPNLKNDDWEKFLKRWADGDLKRGHPDYKAMLRYKSDVDEYKQRREREQTEYMPMIEEHRETIHRILPLLKDLTIDEAGKQQINEIVTLVTKLLGEMENIFKYNSVPPSFNPQQKSSQN